MASYTPLEPLQPTKTIPHIPAPRMSLKHPYSSPASSPNKRVKTTPISLRFKVPQPRDIRHLTPTTSTAAFSSSPRQIDTFPPRSHPALKRRTNDITLPLQPDTTLVFGRHRHHRTDLPGSSQTPNSFKHLLAYPSRECGTIHLPVSACHASRVHAIVESAQAAKTRVIVVGQNGLRVKIEGRWKKFLAGQIVEVKGRVEIDFYGVKVRMSSTGKGARVFTPEKVVCAGSSLPPSSPPMEEFMEEEEVALPDSPLSPNPIPLPLDEQLSRPLSKTIKSELLDISTKPEPLELPSLPTGIDLPALLASTVVFSGSTKLSLPDLVKHMLEAQPSLRVHGDEEVWSGWSSITLEREGMFGKVQRHGKDSSGRPLLPHYFYNPDADHDGSRAKELGGLVRPLRSVQRGGGKAIDWRPVGSGRRRY